MLPLSRSQLLLAGAAAVAILLVGARSMRSSGAAESPVVAPRAGIEVQRSPSARHLVVHVAGEVRRPGVYAFAPGARVDDAVRRAGGPTGDALTAGVNLAARLTDGQQVQMPARAAALGGGGAEQGASGAVAPFNIATATAEQLQEIDGIGEKTAEKILDFRQEKGGISRVEDLDAIPGVGPKTLEKLKSGP